METTCNDSPFSTPSASPGPARNPSPPSEELLSGEDRSKLLEADTIQNTVFSKHWVFSILMKLLKHVESEPKAGQSVDEGADGARDARDDGIDIDEELENDLCHLWDMTANVEVSKFLHEWKSPDIFLSIISTTNAPRITEICIGVLGNMACCPAIRQEFSKNQQLIDLTLGLMTGSDAPTMVETSRLIYTCLNDEECAPNWLETVRRDGEVLRSITFILQSSTNSDLIHNVADMLDQLLDLDDELLKTWSGPLLIQSITEALNQVSNERPNTLSLLHHSLQVISTTEAGVDGLVELSEKVLPLVTSFISSVFDEGILATRGRENTLASVISVLSVMALRSKNVSRILSETENGTLKQLAEMLYVIHRKDTTSRKVSVDGSSSSEAIHKDADAANQEQNSNADTTNSEQNGKSMDVVLGKVVGCHGDNGDGDRDDGADNDDEVEEEEEDPEKVWLTELLKDRLIDFFCCVLEVAKKCKALQTKLHTCGSARLSSLRECLPDDRNDLIDLIDGL